jgi:hypothetical protein
VRFDRFGGLFNLLSLDVIEAGGTLTSSAGGLQILTGTGIRNFSGPTWTNVSWIDFSSIGSFTGIDTLVFASVSEPGTLLLLVSGLLGLCIARRLSMKGNDKIQWQYCPRTFILVSVSF